MSVGHRHHHGGLTRREIDDMLADPRVRKALAKIKRGASINSDYEIPYLAGYSEDGRTIYLDKELPKAVKISGEMTDVRPFIVVHEMTEKAVIDALDARYEVAHDVATDAEHRAVSEAGIRWRPYQDALEPFIKIDEEEPIKDIPPDLDLTPYKDDPTSSGMLRKMRRAMAKSDGWG